MTKNNHKETLMLIDSHALLHRGYHAMSAFSTSDGRHSGAIYGFIRMIIGGAEMIKPDYVIACYDLPKPTFRHIAFDGYKGHRKSIDDELVNQIRDSKKIMEALGVQVCELEGFEADDLLGTFAAKYSDKYNIAIVSGDMDTLQLVNDDVRVYTLKKGSEVSAFGEKEVKDKYELEPKQIPDYKGLAGDASDNIPGVMGVGPKTAIKILKEYGTVENLYANIKENEEKVKKIITGKIYETIKSSEEEAIFSKSLATIRLDAPLTLHLTHRWREGVNQDEYKKWCENYELRSLRNAFEKKENSIPEIKVNVDHLDNGKEVSEDKVKQSKENKKTKAQSQISESELHELQVMSILLNSEKIKASLEDIKILYGIDEEVNDFETIRAELFKLLEKDDKVKYFEEIEKPIMHLVELMRKFGIEISVSELHVQLKSVTEILNKLEQEIYKLAGKEFLISSPKQLGDVLYDTLGLGSKIKKTAGGQRSTNVDMLEKIKDEHAIVPLIMQWREISKVLNTYLTPLEGFVHEDGRVHPYFIQAGAATGRFSCEYPNMQNLPRNSEIGQAFRKVFVASEDCIFLSFDYSQIDLRCAAILSGDVKLIDIFQNNIDIHRGVAAEVLHKKLDEVTDEERRKAKAINFGILYGMGVTALKDAMNTDRATAQEFFDNFKNTFTRLMEYLEEVKSYAKANGNVLTLLGRKRDVPMIKSHIPFIKAQGERIAINAPIQGTSAEVLKLGMIDVYEKYKDEMETGKLKLLLQIHDELVFEVKKGEEKIYIDDIRELMENVLQKRKLSDLPLKVSSSTGLTLYEL